MAKVQIDMSTPIPFIQALTPIHDGNYPTSARPSGLSLDSVSGSIVDGGVITLSGAGFQTAPTYTVYENFEQFTAAGQNLTTSNSTFDSTPSVYIADSIADSRSGTYSVNMFTENEAATDLWQASANTFTLTDNPTEVFASYSVKNPTGKRLPGNPIPAANTFPADSIAKFAWLLDVGSATNDLVIPTIPAQARFSLAGNDLGNIYEFMGGMNPPYWRFGEWIRFTTYLKAGAVPEVDAGTVYFQGMNAVDGMTEYTTPSNDVIFLNGTGPNYKWQTINFAGWFRDGDLDPNASEVEVLFDDIYVAWGDNAAARVEIGDNAVYTSCTKLSVCDHVTWNAVEITATVRQSDLNFGANVYLFVTLGDNTTRDSIQVITI